MNPNKITLEISAGSAKQFVPKDLPEIAFSGKSNVGKSSLINCLLNRKALARVSATPGKTVTVNFYNFDRCVRLVDLPGYGYAKVSREGQGSWSPVVDKYFTASSRCDLVLQLIDIRHDLAENDRIMLDYLDQLHIPFAVILTKADKLKKAELEKRLDYFRQAICYDSQPMILPFSSVNRMGRDELLHLLTNVTGQDFTTLKI